MVSLYSDEFFPQHAEVAFPVFPEMLIDDLCAQPFDIVMETGSPVELAVTQHRAEAV